METLLRRLRQAYPHIVFSPGASFYWSPSQKRVTYTEGSSPRHIWSLLHETGHALLEHTGYANDLELLHLEVAAWRRAEQLAQTLGVDIEAAHIQQCLDSYRDWLFARSTCPRCLSTALQLANGEYQCFNCKTQWRVSRSRFCRIYRATLTKGHH